MRLQNWFIRNLDDIQREVIIESIDKNIIVQGAAGSGKTNLAIHRALQAKDKGSYAIVIMTQALRRMISYGMKELGLNNERIAYAWAWRNRGFDLIGDVYCVGHEENQSRIVIDDKSILYLVNGAKVRKFKFVNRKFNPPYLEKKNYYGIDFADWVPEAYYRAWGRRESWFEEVSIYGDNFSVQSSNYHIVPSGTLFMPSEERIDYLIIDEAQDFNVTDYKLKFIPYAVKSLSLLGDSRQMMNSKGATIQALRNAFPEYKTFDLKYNYRLPKTIARLAQRIQIGEDLLTNNLKNGGDSDYPSFPKPIIKKCVSRESEIQWIANKIKNELLDDVAILVKNDSEVQEVVRLLAENGITEVQTFYRTGKSVPWNTINTLDFSNNDLPCILDYYAAKGSEFDNVFVPFANEGSVGTLHDFFVACTRASHSLYITYSGQKTTYLKNVDNNDIVELY